MRNQACILTFLSLLALLQNALADTSCFRPSCWKVMNTAEARKFGWQEFNTGQASPKPKIYRQQIQNTIKTSNWDLTTIDPGGLFGCSDYTSGNLRKKYSLSDNYSALLVKDEYSDTYTTCTLTGSHSSSDDNWDWRTQDLQCVGGTTHVRFTYQETHTSETASVTTVNCAPVWSGSGTCSGIKVVSISNDPANPIGTNAYSCLPSSGGFGLTSESGGAILSVQSPTQETYTMTVGGQYPSSESTVYTLSKEFTTHRMIDIAKGRATLTDAELNAANWTKVGSAYTLKDQQDFSVELRKMWYFFQFPTEPGVNYTVRWTEITVGLEGGVGVSVVKREWRTPSPATGGVMRSPRFLLDPPYYDAIMFVVDEVVCPDGASDSCSSTGNVGSSGPSCCGGAGGPGGPQLDGVSLDVSLGMTGYDQSAGRIHLQTAVPDEMTATAASFQVINPASDTEIILTAGALSQAKSRQFLAHVEVVSGSTVALHVFPASQINPTKVNGLYATNGATETVVWRVDAPLAAQGNYSRITIAESHGQGAAAVTQYDYDQTGNSWTILSPDNLMKWRKSVVWDSVNLTLTQTDQTLNLSSGQVTSQRINVYRIPQGTIAGNAVLELIQTITGIGTESRTSNFTWQDPGGYPYAYQNGAQDWSGRWTQSTRSISYPATADDPPILIDRPTVESSANLDYAYTVPADPALCRQVLYSYDSVDPSNDDGKVLPNLARMETEYLLGAAVSRIERVIHSVGSPPIVDWIKEYRLPSQDAPLTDANTLVTTTTYYTSGGFAGRVSRVVSPDQTMTSYSYVDSGGNRTTTVDRGQPNAGQTAVVDGTRTVTVVAQDGRLLANTTSDIVSGLATSSATYSNFDNQGRAQTVTYLDGTTDSLGYGCCTLDSMTGRDGTVTTYGYDSLKRRTSEAVAGVASLTDYDYSGNVGQTRRLGTDQSIIILSQSHYNTANELDSETNSLGAITTYSDILINGVRTRTTTSAVGLPEVATRVETYYLDGRLHKTSGAAAAPALYEFGIETDATAPSTDQRRSFQKTTSLDANGGTTEWTKSYADFLGRTYKTIYADATTGTLADNPYAFTEFNTLGQVNRRTDPDGVATLLRYNAKGELVVTAVDLDSDGIVANYDGAATGKDRVTQTLSTYLASGASGNTRGTNIRRTETTVWTTDNSAATARISTTDSSLDGLQTWNLDYKDQAPTVATSWTQTTYSGGGNRTVTSNRPDGSYTVQAYSNGRLGSVTEKNSSNGHVMQTTYTYDAQGRQWKVTDARNGTTVFGYKSGTDLPETVTTPAPGTGEAAQVTTTLYDNLLRPKSITQPDGSVVYREYFPTGQLKKTYGSRTYPTEYTYDAQGRMGTMKTWQDYSGNQNSAITTWNYNPYRGWLDSKLYQGQTVGTAYSYSKGGRLKTRTWARVGTGGQRIMTTYTYGFDDGITGDEHGDLLTVVYSNDPVNTPSITHAYDRRGRRRTTLFNGMTTTYAYNDANQPLTEAYSGGTLGGLTVSWGYDNYLRRNSLGANTATAISQGYTYDSAGRLSTVTDGIYSAAYGYYANSRLVNTVTSQQNSTTRLTVSRNYDLLERLRGVTSTPAATNQLPDFSGYQYNSANQRTRRTLADGSYWVYAYDTLGQVISGKRYWGDGTPVAGQQFEYAFDDIGNRKSTGGRASAVSSYANNYQNQISSRSVAGTIDVLGIANPTAPVTVNTLTANRHGEYFQYPLAVNNTSSAQYPQVTVLSTYGATQTYSGQVFVPPAAESFGYDADGNLTSDGRWTTYVWDGENRLVEMRRDSGTPSLAQQRLTFEYDFQGRRIRKAFFTWVSGAWAKQRDTGYLYDGWNMVAELDANNSNAKLRTYVWGNDLSGTRIQAGGVGGLLWVNNAQSTYNGLSVPTGVQFAAYDGNGNVAGLVAAIDGSVSARYEYGPFGEPLRTSGALAKVNPVRFSTKYADNESGLVYYGYRYYNSTEGRWLGRDPIQELDGPNLYAFVHNYSIGAVDTSGRQAWGWPIMPWPGAQPNFPPRPPTKPRNEPDKPNVTWTPSECGSGMLTDFIQVAFAGSPPTNPFLFLPNRLPFVDNGWYGYGSRLIYPNNDDGTGYFQDTPDFGLGIAFETCRVCRRKCDKKIMSIGPCKKWKADEDTDADLRSPRFPTFPYPSGEFIGTVEIGWPGALPTPPLGDFPRTSVPGGRG